MFAKNHVSSHAAQSERATTKKMGRPRKDDSLRTQKQLLEQITLLRSIQLRAKMSNPEMERALKAHRRIGLNDGNQGKYWRRWSNGEYLCSPAKLREICKVARKRGWLSDDIKMPDLIRFTPAQWQRIVEREAKMAANYRDAVIGLTRYRDTLKRILKEGHDLVDGYNSNRIEQETIEIEPAFVTTESIENVFNEVLAKIERVGSWELHSTVPLRI
jgi:hypothetical protein